MLALNYKGLTGAIALAAHRAYLKSETGLCFD